ncbi:MAG TPA: YggT family protein [Solimonas sp.]|nr:YggT family protein [Solimonas sp.]
MGANATNAAFFLITTVFNLLIWALILRVLLQRMRADFYNPISQMIWKVTRYPADFLRRVLPPWRNFNLAVMLVVVGACFLYVYVVVALLSLSVTPLAALLYAALKIIVMTLDLYTFTLFVQAMMSWLGPGVNNPASNILWSLNEPLLRPVRRVIPPLGGMDLSPLVLILALQVLKLLVPLPGIFR